MKNSYLLFNFSLIKISHFLLKNLLYCLIICNTLLKLVKNKAGNISQSLQGDVFLNCKTNFFNFSDLIIWIYFLLLFPDFEANKKLVLCN